MEVQNCIGQQCIMPNGNDCGKNVIDLSGQGPFTHDAYIMIHERKMIW